MSAERIFLSKPDVGELEEECVVRALRSGWVAPLGPEVDAFEKEMAERIGRDHAVALSSGTAALHLGLLAIGVSPGDIVITSTMTFAATANAIVYAGAQPCFVDCLPDTGNMDPALLSRALSQLEAQGKMVSAIIPVDLLGRAADYSTILPIADAEGIPVLSDAAEALGAMHKGKPAGSFGRAAILSFNGNKIMTTSGGGMLLTDHANLAERVRYLATQARQPVTHYQHTDIGYNYRMSNILAALGRAQLSRLDSMIDRRRALRAAYKELFEGLPGITIFQGDGDGEDNFWLTSIIVDPDLAGWSTGQLSGWLARHSIESRPLWKPMHMQPVFKGALAVTNGCSEALFRNGLTLPSGSGMSADQVRKLFEVLDEFLELRAEKGV